MTSLRFCSFVFFVNHHCHPKKNKKDSVFISWNFVLSLLVREGILEFDSNIFVFLLRLCLSLVYSSKGLSVFFFCLMGLTIDSWLLNLLSLFKISDCNPQNRKIYKFHGKSLPFFMDMNMNFMACKVSCFLIDSIM